MLRRMTLAPQNAPQPSDRYLIDFARPVPGFSLRAFAVQDRRDETRPLIGLLAPPGQSLRLDCLPGPATADRAARLAAHPAFLMPLARFVATRPDGEKALCAVCPPPPGPSLAESTATWNESALLDQLLPHLLQCLVLLNEAGLCHRDIRPETIFQKPDGGFMLLAPIAPPGYCQPCVFEPPWRGVCPPEARGTGQLADDIYAIGVTLLCLYLGQLPGASAPPDEVARRKFEDGNFAALTGGVKLPSRLALLVRRCLADDEAARPRPAVLMAELGKMAPQIIPPVPVRALRPFRLGADIGHTKSSLALAITRNPAEAAAALHQGDIGNWLKRSLGDLFLAARLEEILHHERQNLTGPDETENALLLIKVIAILDPAACLLWHHRRFMPDGLGPALASPAMADILSCLERGGLAAFGRTVGGERQAALAALTQTLLALYHEKPPLGGSARLVYALNPFLPALSGPIAGACDATDVIDLLENHAQQSTTQHPQTPAAHLPLDGPALPFLAARSPAILVRVIQNLASGGRLSQADEQLKALAALQSLSPQPTPAPHLAAGLAAALQADLRHIHNLARREAVSEALTAHAAVGFLQPMLHVLNDPRMRAGDLTGARQAADMLDRIAAEQARIKTQEPAHAAHAARLGRQMANGVAALALGAAIVMAMAG
ncbi:MAG: hypothetical protein B7Z78_02960 [Rhodospirillales bacterium 20-60-12]|nr:MAG: hypothetical protein B7Z78_02960 [Rhodospirillales bacterium 20-60-12]